MFSLNNNTPVKARNRKFLLRRSLLQVFEDDFVVYSAHFIGAFD